MKVMACQNLTFFQRITSLDKPKRATAVQDNPIVFSEGQKVVYIYYSCSNCSLGMISHHEEALPKNYITTTNRNTAAAHTKYRKGKEVKRM